MKYIITFFIVLIVIFQSSYSQSGYIDKNICQSSIDSESTQSYESIYFILGSLSDYMGRYQYVDKENQVDRYYPYEKPLVTYLTDYIRTELNIIVDTEFEKSNHCEMFSEELAKTLNSFYKENGKLIKRKFTTNEEIYSFLAGVYYRYGEKLDSSIYKIQLANSPKHQICYEILKQIGCENIFYQYLRNIPAQFILYFEPTDELKKYLESIESEAIMLKESYLIQMEEIMKEHMTKEELENDFQDSKNKELERIKTAFRR